MQESISEKFKTTLADIEYIKIAFQKLIKKSLNLIRISAPLFLDKESGLNDDLTGKEEKVSFIFDNKCFEIVQSLAKWKRYALMKYNIDGLYADMNAIRKSETLDETHSIYVDQWDWEKVINDEKSKDQILTETAIKIHNCIYELEQMYCKMKNEQFKDNNLKNQSFIPHDLFIISSEDLLKIYPLLTPKQREYEIAKIHKAVFIKQIGKQLSNGSIHDSRAPDYDDWEYNGDLIYWSDVLNAPIEISSMGVRVNSDSLIKQLNISKCNQRLELPYCKMIINNQLPQTIGGGIGQSRLCMLILRKSHISQVQSSYWDANNLKPDSL